MSAVPRHYRSDIDGLRAIAVLAVVFHHLSYDLAPGGYVGVDVFFVISGYLITGIVTREIAEGRFSFVRFYERRIRRIFPALFAVLAATLVAGYFLLLPSDYLATFKASVATLFFSSNVLFWRELAAGYFAADAKLNPLLHTWSLAVEEQFYLVFPVFLLLCWRFARRHVAAVLASAAVLSLFLASAWVDGHSVAVFFLTPFRAWELLAGALLALGGSGPAWTRDRRWLREAIAGIGLLALLVPVYAYDIHTRFPGLAAVPPVLGTVLLIHAGRSTAAPAIVTQWLQWRPLVYVGLVSYSLYLWHWPLIVFARFALGMAPITPYIPLLFAASLVLASLSYHLVEQPFRHARRDEGRRRVFGAAAAAAAVLATVSVAGVVRDGMPGRVSAQALAMDQARDHTVPAAIKACERRVAEGPRAWCRMGPAGVPGTVLLWGDSHLMAWAPALEHAFSEGAPWAATLVPNSACPPVFGVENADDGGCFAVNEAVRRHLQDNPHIRSVVLSARWPIYLEDGDGYEVVDPAVPAALADALQATVDWLVGQGIQVVLVGPVPGYDASVPLMLALHEAPPSTLSHTYADARRANPSFYAVAARARPGVVVVDPARWICAPDCIVQRNRVSHYRDANHLSIAGALAYRGQLASALRDALAGATGRGALPTPPANEAPLQQ